MNRLVTTLLKLIFNPSRKTINYQTTKNEAEIIDENRIIDLSFNKLNKRLTFKIQHYHAEPKISRYVQRNYKRFPIYDGQYSERTKIIKSFNKVINPIKFVNEDILTMDLDREFILEIIDTIGIIPAWREKELKIESLQKKINDLTNATRNFDEEAKVYQFKHTTYPENPSNFWVRLLFSPITLGFSFKRYTSKKQAAINKNLNQENKVWNEEYKNEIDQENLVLKEIIEKNNSDITNQVFDIYQKIKQTELQEITYEKKYEDGWSDLKDASNAYYPQLQNKKGIYIIWNKTKNKYYVGQSKNLKSGLMTHFKDGEPKNIIFAKDWLEGDHFVYKCHFCETKDELDLLKTRYIEEYFAFENGYNRTKGSI